MQSRHLLYQAKLNRADSPGEFQGWREVIITYGDNYGWKKLFQLIPVVGIIFGAIINCSTVEEVAETGMMLYRKRRITEKLKMIDAGSGEDFLL